jgi:phosphoribosylformylglycinamidine synthase
VVPRPGTISPWSSKATDIFHNCGLNKVRRVERGIVWRLTHEGPALDGETLAALGALLHDPMTQSVVPRVEDAGILFRAGEPGALRRLPLSERGVEALRDANNAMGLALSSEEIDYLVDAFKSRGRNPTDVELMMFAQANSEHCRHKIFNAQWTLDDVLREDSLFDLIRATYSAAPGRVISAYTDNAAVMRGYSASRFCPNSVNRLYEHFHEDVHLVMKVETHNGHLTSSRGGHRGRGRNPRRGSDRNRRQTNGRPDRICGIQSPPSRATAALGRTQRRAGTCRPGTGNHA